MPIIWHFSNGEADSPPEQYHWVVSDSTQALSLSLGSV